MPQISKSTPTTTKKPPAPPAGIKGRIKDLHFDDDDGIHTLLYGRSGTGKTTVWGTFPAPILAMICSGGNRPGELRSLYTPENKKRIKVFHIESPQDVMELVELQQKEHLFKTLVMDHVSSFQDLVLGEITGMKIPEQKSWGLATQQQYGQCTAQVKETLKALLGIKENAVIIGQQRTFDAGESESEELSEIISPHVGPGVTPSLAGWLTASCDYVINTFIRAKTEDRKMTIGTETMTTKVKLGGVEYCARTGPSEVFSTKFRMPLGKSKNVPQIIVDPTYDKIITVIRS